MNVNSSEEFQSISISVVVHVVHSECVCLLAEVISSLSSLPGSPQNLWRLEIISIKLFEVSSFHVQMYSQLL